MLGLSIHWVRLEQLCRAFNQRANLSWSKINGNVDVFVVGLPRMINCRLQRLHCRCGERSDIGRLGERIGSDGWRYFLAPFLVFQKIFNEGINSRISFVCPSSISFLLFTFMSMVDLRPLHHLAPAAIHSLL